MKYKKWAPKEKLQIVLEGIKGKLSLGEVCAQHGISQTLYYRWRDQLLEQGSKIFENGGPSKTEERLRRENAELKRVVGELTMELKKSDF